MREGKVFCFDNKFIKAAVILLLCAVALWLAGSYVKSPLTDRAIVLGMGIDYDGKEYTVTAEVAAPSDSADGAAGGQSKVLDGKGETLPLAIHDIYRATGKNPSLGQTGIVLLGKGMGEVNLCHVLGFFVFSDAFKDGVTLAYVDGEAKDVFETATPVDSVVSFGLQSIIQSAGKKTTSPSNFIENFIEAMTLPSKTSFATNVKFTPAQSSGDQSQSEGSDKKEGSYDCSLISVFKDGKFAATLEENESRGFTMIKDDGAFDSFAVEDADTVMGGKDTVSVGIASKEVDRSYAVRNGVPVVRYDVKIRLSRMKTDVSGSVIGFLPKTDDEIDEKIKTSVKEEATSLIKAAVDKSVALDCDFMEVANGMYKALGKEWREYQKANPDYLSKTKTEINITIEN